MLLVIVAEIYSCPMSVVVLSILCDLIHSTLACGVVYGFLCKYMRSDASCIGVLASEG